MGDENPQPQMPNGHRSDALVTKFVDKTGELQEKAQQTQDHLKSTNGDKDGKQDKQPAGGYDKTPIPQAPPGFTVKFTFHRATNLPMADVHTLSSDPYVFAQLNTDLRPRHKEDPPMRFRTQTIRRNTQPVWDCGWIVANVPADGFVMKIRIYDEDPADHDDRLGDVHIHVDRIGEDWEGIHERPYKIKKKKGSKRAYLIRSCASMFSSGVDMHGELVFSAQVLGRTESNGEGRAWTVGPCQWRQHLSPLIGRLAGTKGPSTTKGKDGKETEQYNFQANQFQLRGPVPAQLYHRYVEFKPFVAGMFTSHSLRGRILNRALHHQFARIYNYDRSTVYGVFPAPCRDMSLQFLELVHFDEGGRVFTYVLTLDAQWRFTETGKEFGIDLLSKHTMHSDVNIYIAFSGEFFVRRLAHPDRALDGPDQATHPPDAVADGPPHRKPPRDPARYELVIDNDSGTYRPRGELLPNLKAFMEANLPGLKVVTLDCGKDKEKMDRWKGQQRERKKKEGDGRVMLQRGRATSSVSSSDVEDLDALEAEQEGEAEGGGRGRRRGRRQRGAERDGDGAGSGTGDTARDKLGKHLHGVADPKGQFMGWMQEGRERELREFREREEAIGGGGVTTGERRQEERIQ